MQSVDPPAGLDFMAQLNLAHLNTLVVDDSRYFVSVLRATLRAFGVRAVYEANSAVAGLEVLTSTAIDLAFVDMVMPGMDGIEFIRMVRTASDSANRTLPIIMLTADGRRGTVLRAVDAGAESFLIKPVRPADVYRHMMELLQNPLPYIDVPGVYFGPERRRMTNPNYSGPERRHADLATPVASGGSEGGSGAPKGGPDDPIYI